MKLPNFLSFNEYLLYLTNSVIHQVIHDIIYWKVMAPFTRKLV